MTEKEAIERLNRFKTIKVLYGNTFAMHLEQLEQLQNDIETLLNLLEKKDRTIQQLKDENRTLNRQAQQYFEQGIKKDKIIDEIQKEVRGHIGFENRLKRDNKEPDLFNQGRFYVANNINNILKGN